jgi:hypothetical protein
MTDDDDDDSAKATKASVHYRHADGRKHCRNCRYSYGPSNDRRCMKVQGQIHGDDVCDLWKGM